MFEADQFHHFIDSTTSTTNPISFPNPFHASSSSSPTISAFSTFDSHDVDFLHQTKNQIKQEPNLIPMNLDTTQTDTDRSVQEWSTDETLTLLRIRSTMENNWFPDFTWDHVSRKLAEFGFKKSAEKCKEKFEEESRYFNNISATNFSKNYRVFGEFEDLYCNNQAEKNKPNQEQEQQQEQEDKIDQIVVLSTDEESKSRTTKRKREKISSSNSNSNSKSFSSFEMFKGFCQDIIGKIIAQQEEMHSKLLEDMAKRDEEKVAREEEWKKQELDRFDKEFQLRAQQQALSTDRQTTIINFLKKFSSSSTTFENKSSSSSISSSPLQNPNPNPNPELPISCLPQKDSNFSTPKSNPNKPNSIQSPNPNSPSNNPINPLIPSSSISVSTVQTANKKSTPMIKSNEKDDLGKRWPKDEVLALINLRCSSLYNNNNSSTTNEEDSKEKESSVQTVKASLWERISKGMMELGYRRSAKRCKEKWENINKYFRKTKDVNKKRSLDSRTCPYFHQLNTLYNQGQLVAVSSDLGTQSAPNNTYNSSNSTSIHQQAAQGDKSLVQASGFEFEF